MLRAKKKAFLSVVFVVSVGMLLIAANLVNNLIAGMLYFDVSSNKEYSLSDVTKSFLENMDRAVTIRFYVSKNIKEQDYVLWQYSRYLQKLLQQYKNQSGADIEIAVVEVEAFQSSEAAAIKAGIKEFENDAGQRGLYLGASFWADNGRMVTIPRLWPDRKHYVEDDITRVLSVLQRSDIPTIGIVSPKDKLMKDLLDDDAKNRPFAEFLSAAGYNVVSLRSTVAEIPEGIDMLILVYPVRINLSLLYALDQYLMRGGRAMVLLDAFYQEYSVRHGQYTSYDSGMKKLLHNMGIRYSEKEIVGDNKNNMPLVIDGQKINYPFDAIVTDVDKHLLAKGIRKLAFSHSGYFEVEAKDNIKTTIVAQTSSDSGVMAADNVVDLDVDTLSKSYVLKNKQYSLAVLLEGFFESVFETQLSEGGKLPFLAKGLKDGKLLLMGDVDFFTERMWAKKNKNFDNIYDVDYAADNMFLLRNIVDYMTQSGYVSAVEKNGKKKAESLNKVFEDMVKAKFLKEDKQAKDSLREVIKQADILQAKLVSSPVQSQKQLKQLETLQRRQYDLEQHIRQIDYQRETYYKQILMWFKILMVVGVPLICVGILWVIYLLYNRKIRSIAKEMVNE